MNNYTIYHSHDDMSLLDSSTKYESYIKRAKELEMSSFGLSNHGNVFNWVKKKQKCNEYGIKYIHGQEFYITYSLKEKVRDNWHCILIAKNLNGVKELNKLSSIGYTRDNHFYYDPRISIDELFDTSDNIIITSSCLGGILNSGIDEVENLFINFMIKNRHRCFLEIQHHNNSYQSEYNKKLYDLSKRYDIMMIAGTDTHNFDKKSEKTRTILQKSKGINFPNETSWDLNFKSYEELIECYKEQNSVPKVAFMEAIENTNYMANMIEDFELDLSYKYPKIYENSNEIFKNKVYDSLHKKELDNNKEYLDRIEYEFEAISKNGAIDYMLLQEKITSWCRENNIIPGYSRGSVSGSLCAYLLGITDIDSIKFNMNFERFMNSERVSLSDIDIDYPPNKREEVKNFIFNNLGLNCCDIVAFNTVASKGSIRDVGRALEMPLDEINDICKNLETLEDAHNKKYNELFDLAKMLDGTTVSSGVHPCGVVTTTLNIDEEFGTFTTTTDTRKISQIDMKCIDSLNFVKLDILGLDNIQIINETCDLVGIERLSPDNINFEDDKVWKDMINSNIGIFQWESDFAHQTFKKLFSEETLNKIKHISGKIDKMSLLSMANGAIRPAGESYREPMCNGIFKDNGHEALNNLLSSTMGYLVYQEDILKFLNQFCGYSMGSADVVRRCVEENSHIMMGDGSYKKIKDISIGDIVQTFNRYNISEPNKVNSVFDNGIAEVFEIETDHGYKLSATSEHKLLTQNGWKNIGDLNLNDYIMTPKKINAITDGLLSSKRLDMKDMYLIGILIGDGSLGNLANIHFTNHEKILIEKFKECVTSRLRGNRGCEFNIGQMNGKNVDKIYSISVKTPAFKESLKNFVLKYNLNYKSNGKKIPSEIMKYPVGEKLSNLLAGLFNTDGGYNSNRISLEYSSTSKILAHQIKSLLLKYGIYSYIGKGFVKDYNYYTYRVNITSPESLENFRKYILPFIVGEKNIKYNEIIGMALNSEKYNYMLPKECKQEIIDMSKNTKKSLLSVGQGYNKDYQLAVHKFEYGISDTKAKKIVQNLYCPKTYNLLMSEFIPIRITSIKNIGIKHVYDIEIDKEHNYIANGMIVHNCFAKKTGDMEKHTPNIRDGFIKTMKQKYNTPEEESEKIVESFLRVIEDASAYLFSLNHSYPYSMIGYACAYLRYYYKLEFLTTMLNVNKNNIEKSSSIISYAKLNKINVSPPKFRFSRSSYFFNKETNTIYKDVSSIKFLNNECGENLYEVGKNKFDNFVDLLMYIEENSKINSRQILTLIKIKFFDEFGKNKKLLNIYNEFSSGKNKYDKKLKQETKNKRIGHLIKFENNETNEEMSIWEQIAFEQESLGYIQATYNLDKKYVYIQKLNEKFSPLIECYSLATGNTVTLKIQKKLFKNKNFLAGDVIFCKRFTKKPSVKFSDGKFIEIEGEFTWWLEDYDIIEQDKIDKLVKGKI